MTGWAYDLRSPDAGTVNVGARAFSRLEAPGIAFGQWYFHAWFRQSPQHEGFVVWGYSVIAIRRGQAEIPDCLASLSQGF